MQATSAGQRVRRTLASGAIVAGAGLGTALAYGQLAEPGSPASAPDASTLDTLAAVKPGLLTLGRQAAVLVCQATGDGTYVTIRVLPDRLDEYRKNPDNIVPAPAGGCPARVGGGSSTTTTQPSTTQTTPPRTTTTAPTKPPRTTTTAPTKPPRTTTATTPTKPPRTTTATTPTKPPRTTTTDTTPSRPPRTTSTATTPVSPPPTTPTSTTPATTTPSSGTSPTTTTGATSKRRRTPTYTGRLSGDLSRLPNTGSDETALLLLGGVALLLAGAGVHLRSRPVGW